MIALLALVLVLALSAGVGRRILGLLGAVPQGRMDAVVYVTAAGLGVIAYLVLVLGLVGLLTKWAVLASLVLLALVCHRGFSELAVTLRSRPEPDRSHPWLIRAATVALVAVGLIVLVNCFVPPGAHEWDALAYHLATPKVYVHNHRILYLPTDHHSNFPFLVEMLFTIGLLFDGYALANLFHFALGALCAGAIVVIGRRHVSLEAGLMGALVFATAPIVAWEAGAAYIELGMALFVTLAIGAALEWRRDGNPRWLTLSGSLMGFALSVKALALVPFFFLAVTLLLANARFKNLRWYLVAALLVGCPFYVKTWLWTGNPVYPFAYSIFGGRHWNAGLASAYAGEQRSFGLHRELINPGSDALTKNPDDGEPNIGQRIRNVLMTPFTLVAVPRLYYNQNDPGVHTHLGFLFLALTPLYLLVQKRSAAGGWMLGIAGLWFLVWGQTMQYVRYLIPMLPLLGIAGGEGAWRLGQCRPWMRWPIAISAALQVGVVAAFFGGAILIGDRFGSRWEIATNAEARETYLTRSVNVYGAERWINQNTPPDAGVVLYEENRGFFLDRPYLWGNALHSTYIPYPSFGSGEEMIDWFLSQKIRYAIVNLRFSPLLQSMPDAADMLMAANQQEALGPLLLQLYHPKTEGGEVWRRFLGEALYNGRAVVVPDASARDVVVVEFRPRVAP
jgi:hypothetical protein